MDAIVLVGGFGTRLLPLTKSLPKPLIPLANMPFIDHTVSWLRDAGVDHIILSLHYNAEQFRAHFARRNLGVDISYALEDSPLGTGGAIKNCEPHLRSGRCYVFNGDIFTNLQLPALLDWHRQNGAQATIALKEVEDPSRFGVIETDHHGRIRSFTEKPPRELARSRDINAGVYVFERSMFSCFPEGPCSVERDVFPKLVEEGGQLYGYQEWPYWTDLGTPQDYLQAHRDILSRKARVAVDYEEAYPGIWLAPGVQIAETALVRPPVLIGSGSVIAEGATVGPAVVLGPRVRVETQALVADTVAWEGTVIRAHSVVQGCIFGRNARVSGQLQNNLCGDHAVLTGESLDYDTFRMAS